MKTPAEYDDYLRAACGLDLLDGPPLTLTLPQARAALEALAADAARYHSLLARAIRNAKKDTPAPPAALVAALTHFTQKP